MLKQVGPLLVEFSSSDPESLDRLNRLYAAFADSPPTTAGRTFASIELDRRNGQPVWKAAVNGSTLRESPHREIVETTLTRKINRLVLDAEPDWLHLHAGAVARDGNVVLIIGKSGSGKSTLVAALVTEGWELQSDEMVRAFPDGRIAGHTRPITLRRNSLPLFPQLAETDLDAEIDRIEVPIDLLGAAYHGAPAKPSLIVCPDARTKEHTREPLSGAATFQALLSDSLDLERAGDDGIEAILALAQAGPAVRISGTDLGATMATVDELSANPSSCPNVVDQSAPSDRSDARVDGANGWLFDDGSAVLFEPRLGSMAVVNAEGFAAWDAYGGGEVQDAAFDLALREQGLIVGPDA